METPADSPANSTTSARSPWKRRLLLLALGLLLLVALLVALAPMLASTLVRGPIQKAFAERFHGHIELDSVHLAWSGRQSVSGARLFDPEGTLVGQADLELPGLWSLLVGRGKRLGLVHVVLSADLVADDAGLSNLDRAIAPRAASVPANQGSKPPPDGGASALADLQIELDLTLEHLSWSDVRSRATGAPFVLDDFHATAKVEPGGSLTAKAAGLLSSGAGGAVQLDAGVEHLFEAASSKTPPTLDVNLELSDLPVALIDQLTAQGGLCNDLLGERVTLSVRAQGTPQAGRASVSLKSNRVQIDARGEIEAGVLRSRDGFALEADVRLPRTVFTERVVPLLPPDASVLPGGDELHLRATISRLSLPIAALIDAQAAGGDVIASLAGSSELALDLELGDWTLVRAPGSEPVRLGALSLGARLIGLAHTARGDLELRAGLSGGDNGALQVRLSTPDLGALAACVAGTGPGRAELALELHRAPSALLAPWTGAGETARLFGDLFDLQADLSGDYDPSGAVSSRLRLDLSSRGKRLTARFDALLPSGLREVPDDGSLPEFELRGELGGLAFLRPLVPATQRPAFDELIGESLSVDLHTRPGEARAADIDLTATSARTRLTFAGTHGPMGLRTRGEAGLSLSMRPSQALITEFLAAKLPAGAHLDLRDEQEGLSLRLTGLDWPAPAPTADGASRVTPPAEPEPLAATLARARAELELTLPAFTWRQPPAAGEGEPIAVQFGALRALASLAPASGLALTATAQLQSGAADALDARLSLPQPAQLLAEPPTPLDLALNLRCRAIPTALVDALAAQDGLLPDVLGATLDLDLELKLPETGEGLKLTLRSPTASLDLVGSLADGTLTARNQQGLQATLPLTPLYTKRIVGALLPMAVGLAKPEGAPPSGVSLTNFDLPLDGDLRKLNCDLRLDLNQVTYRVLPGFTDLIANAVGTTAPGARVLTLPPLDLKVREGRVTYQRLPLEINGEPTEFSGTFDLVTRELDLTTNLRLGVLGDKVGSELAKARGYLDPNTQVPLRITGTPRKPRVTIGRDFLEKVLKDAAGDALQKGLGDLLNKTLKKDG